MSLHPRSRWQSLRYALRGIGRMLRTETNARIHVLATIGVISLGLTFGIARLEWLAVILAIACVWSTEAINSAFEALCDVASPDYHPRVERAKDIAAGAVLLAAIAALGVGFLIFGPYVIAFITR